VVPVIVMIVLMKELMMMSDKPIKEEWNDYYCFLNNLRASGITNMFGGAPYLMSSFDLPKKLAVEILLNWMENYDEVKDL
jgi:hypothetical protein